MIEMDDWFMIRELHAQGLSITAISDKTGYDRKTVRKYLNSTTTPEQKQRAKKESKRFASVWCAIAAFDLNDIYNLLVTPFFEVLHWNI